MHLGRCCSSGYEVIRGAQPEFDLLRPDLMTAAVEAANPDFVIHLAGISFVAHDNAAALYAVNTGTTSFLKALEPQAARLRKVILASTSQVYGNATDDPITEQTPTAPVSHYACSKLAMESMARTWFNRLPILITRPFNYTDGASIQFLVPKLVDHFRRRAPVVQRGNLMSSAFSGCAIGRGGLRATARIAIAIWKC